jgi:CheY-like chemotaxis protein
MRKKVMVIDDDENAVKFLSVLLSESGYEPIVAYDGKEGLQKIEEHAVDLIVLDVMMPKKTGFVLFKQLKKREEYKDIPILMLTAVAASLTELDAEKEDTFERPYDSLRESLRKGGSSAIDGVVIIRQRGNERETHTFILTPAQWKSHAERVETPWCD